MMKGDQPNLTQRQVGVIGDLQKAQLAKDKKTQKELSSRYIGTQGYKKITGDYGVDRETGETTYDPWSRWVPTGNKYLDSTLGKWDSINNAVNSNADRINAAESALSGRLHDLNKLPESYNTARMQGLMNDARQQFEAEHAVEEAAVETNGKKMYPKPDGTVTDDYWNAVLSWSSDIPAMWEYATTGQLKLHDGTVIYGGDADKPDQNDIKANEPFALDGMSSATATKPKDMLRLDGMTMAAPASGVQGGVTEVPPQKQSGFDDFLAQYANTE